MSALRLSETVLQELEQLCERRDFSIGETITAKGDTHSSMFFILAGWVQIHFHEEIGEERNIRVGERSILGEMGFLSGENAIATSQVVSPVTALEMDRQTLQQLKARNPDAARELSDYLANTIDRRLQSNADFGR